MTTTASILKRANRLTEHLSARMTKPVQVKIMGWGGTRKIPKKELVSFAKALKDPSLRGAGVGFSAFKQMVQINPKYLPALEKIVKAQGKRMGPPKKGAGIIGIDCLDSSC